MQSTSFIAELAAGSGAAQGRKFQEVPGSLEVAFRMGIVDPDVQIEAAFDVGGPRYMQSLHRIFRSNIFGFLLAALAPIAVCSAAITAIPFVKTQTAEVQSASGRITSVQGNTFTLETPQAQNNSGNQFLQDDQKVITLMIDQNTAVDGKIEVGADANVTYQQQDGNNIAVSVHIVKQPS